MGNELHIIVRVGRELAGYPVTAALIGTNSRGHGTTVADALQDLFTSMSAAHAAEVLEASVNGLVQVFES